MNPSKRGVGTAGKAGVVVLVIVVVAAAYLVVPSFSKGGGSQPTTSAGGPNPIADQTQGLYPLLTTFSGMQLIVDINDVSASYIQNSTYSYSVLGKGTLNSTQYTKVDFATLGETHDTIAWFNSTGGLGELDVLGVTNYTGRGLYNLPYIQTYVNAFYALISVTNNATLFSHLTETTQTTKSIGPTKADVTTYVMQTRTRSISKATAEVATIPGTNIEMAVYLYEKLSDGSTYVFQVSSLTR